MAVETGRLGQLKCFLVFRFAPERPYFKYCQESDLNIYISGFPHIQIAYIQSIDLINW